MTDYPPPPPGYIAEPCAPRPVRPPFTAGAKRGAALGGGLGFTLWTLGYALVAIPVGIGLVVAFFAAILLSGLVLRRHEVRHPWGVTFAGAGIAIVAASLVEGFLGAIVSGVGSAFFDGNSLGPGIIVSGVVALAINAAIGWRSRWWMAHAMRPAATEAIVSEAVAIGDRA